MIVRSRLAALGVLAALTACAPADDGGAAAPTGNLTPGQGACTPGALKTLQPNTFTLGTDDPAYAPWFTDNEPANGRGFESAVGYAVAQRLGYSGSQVRWARVPFNVAIQPGPKRYDADLNEFSITEARRRAVDFSAPYYDVRQVVLATKTSRAAGVRSLAGLRGLKLGAQVGTTSYDVAKSVLGADTDLAVYNNNDDAKQALASGQIQALVLDLPTAFEVAGAGQVDGAVIVGQLPATGSPEQFGAVLDKDSPLTGCVSAAVRALRADGTLAKLTERWLARAGKAPELR